MQLQNTYGIYRKTKRRWAIINSRLSFVLIFLSISFQLYAQEDDYAFCFSSSVSLAQVKRSLEPIRAPKDQFFSREKDNCLEIKLSPGRKELFEKYLRGRFSLERIETSAGGMVNSFVSQENPQHCQIEIVMTTVGDQKNTNAGLGGNFNAKQDVSNESGTSRSQILVTSGKSAGIQMDQRFLNVTCILKGNGAELIFSTGSKNNSLTSSIYVSHGQKIDVGQIADQLDNKAHTISVNNGLEIQQTSKQVLKKYELILK